MEQRSPEEKRQETGTKERSETRPLGGGYGEEPVRVADLEAWARLRAT